MSVIGYVSPGCGLCDDLAAHFAAFARHGPADVGVFLVTEMAHERAVSWANEHRLRIPMLAGPDIMRQHLVPGSPYVVVLLNDGSDYSRVLGTGVVNTLEQLEDVFVQANDNRQALAEEDARSAFAVIPPAAPQGTNVN